MIILTIAKAIALTATVALFLVFVFVLFVLFYNPNYKNQTVNDDNHAPMEVDEFGIYSK